MVSERGQEEGRKKDARRGDEGYREYPRSRSHEFQRTSTHPRSNPLESESEGGCVSGLLLESGLGMGDGMEDEVSRLGCHGRETGTLRMGCMLRGE